MSHQPILNKYLEKVAYRHPEWYTKLPQIKKMNDQRRFFQNRVEGIRNAMKQLLENKAYIPSTKRRYA